MKEPADLDRPGGAGLRCRLIGAQRSLNRKDSDTLRRELDAAYGSWPDTVGVIELNGFRRNGEVEPSLNYSNN